MQELHPESNADAQEVADVFHRFSQALGRRRKEFFFVFAMTFLGVQSIAFFWPGTFAGQAAILLERSRPSAQFGSDPTDSPTVSSKAITEEEVNSEIALITSVEVLTATIRSTGLDRVPPSWYMRILFAPLRAYEALYAQYQGVPAPDATDRALRSLGKSISVEHLKDSNILVITYEAGDPRFAEQVLAQLLQNYLEQHLRIHSHPGAEEFFSTQVDALARELTSQEDALAALKKDAKATDIAAERDLELKHDASLKEEASLLQRRLGEFDAKIDSYDRLLNKKLEKEKSLTRIHPNDEVLAKMKEDVLQLEREQVRLEVRYRQDSLLVMENRKKLEMAQRALEEQQHDNLKESTTDTSPTRLAVEQERARLIAERAGTVEAQRTLTTQMEVSRARIMELDQKVIEAIRIQRLIRAAEERYMMYLGRGEKARIDAALDRGRFTNVSIVQSAAASPHPVRPKRLVVFAASSVGGALIALVSCLWLELHRLGLSGFLASATPRV